MTPAEMMLAAIAIAIGPPDCDSGDSLMSRRARDAIRKEVMGSANDRRASPMRMAAIAAVREAGLLGSDDTVATPISATYSAKNRAGATSTEMTEKTRATVALTDSDRRLGPSFGRECRQSTGSAGAAFRLDPDRSRACRHGANGSKVRAPSGR